jgi:hypothetical protein
MRQTAFRLALALAALGLVHFTPLAAQATPAMHIGHVADAFNGTPNGQGLLPTAVAEAQTAEQHAQFAAQDPTNLSAMKSHAGHVLHAIDPSLVSGGPGLGYGVKRAAQGVVQHIEAAAGLEGASDNVKTHAVHIATAARNVLTWCDAAVATAQQIQAATTAAQAAPLVTRLQTLTHNIVAGTDANGDGRIGWQEGEGGLAQATQHMALLKRGEGLAN